MCSPMFELPEHFLIGVNINGDGPIDENDPEFDHMTCWCSDPFCHFFTN
jgi:hypothetical protein